MPIPDLVSIDRHFIYLSNVYKYIEQFERMGHQAGRKVGDMLELIVMGKIYQKETLLNKLAIEPKLEGQTTAEHKVEFAFFNNPTTKQDLFGFIECKKVGVEATKHHLTKNGPLTWPVGDIKTFNYSPQWIASIIKIDIHLLEIDNNLAHIEVIDRSNNDEILSNFSIAKGERFRIAIDEHGIVHVVNPRENLTQITALLRICQLFILEHVGTSDTKWNIFDCLTGPQTPEKAKQASLVALDVRRKIDGHWGKEELTQEEKTLTSIQVIGEFSHWESKSRNMIITCSDYNFVVPDEIIIHAFEEFHNYYGHHNYWNSISKTRFQNDSDIRQLIFNTINYFNGNVFYDITTKFFVDFGYLDNHLIAINNATGEQY